ncbi:CoA-transferase family III, partial [Aureobasidium melanogenum]|uniref:CoA-transferase family III n=1 Tax=Aureobasidium melanogenum (strain CBS 110374) TaxID=1043003 RepID=A0A074VQ10_AURM1
MSQSPPLTGLRVLEFAGLAPGPFAGLLLADWGASVLRIDRSVPGAHTSTPPPPTSDLLTRHKTSIAVDIKSPSGISLILSLIPHVDILIDPFRPGVLEKAGLGPENVLLKLNPRLIVARMTGFRRDGKYSSMAGHDINYLAVSGVLSQLGRKEDTPYPPANLLGDFGGGGLVCFLGIVMAVLQRQQSGKGQVVEANMVDGVAYLGIMPRLARKTPMWDKGRGENLLDGGCPYYDTYECKDGRYMAVGALEPHFFTHLLKGLNIPLSSLSGPRDNRTTWPALRTLFTRTFKSKTRAEWEKIFDGTDACCTPVLTQDELEENGYDQRPIVTLRDSPGKAIAEGDADTRPACEGQGIGVQGNGWESKGLAPGVGGEEVLARWMGWSRGRQYDLVDGGLVRLGGGSKL